MKIFETPNLSKEKKDQLEVEKILGRREVKKPGRLRRFLGETIPGYENVIGKYWERMANYLEQEDVREALVQGKSEEQIKKDILKRKEAAEEKAIDKTTQSFRESIMEDAGVKEPEIIELTEEMVMDEPKIIELTKEMVIEDVGEKKLDEVKKDVKELAAKADKMFEDLRKKYKGRKWDKADEDYKKWLETTREVGILSKSLREKEKETGDMEELAEPAKEKVVEEKEETTEDLKKSFDEVLDRSIEDSYRNLVDELKRKERRLLKAKEELENAPSKDEKLLKFKIKILEKEVADIKDRLTVFEETKEEKESAEEPSVVVSPEYTKEIEEAEKKEKKAASAVEEGFMKEGEWMDKISRAIPKKKLEKLGIDIETEAKTLVEIGKYDLSFTAEDYFKALVKNNNKKMKEYLNELYEKVVKKVGKKKEHALPEEPTKARASIRGER